MKLKRLLVAGSFIIIAVIGGLVVYNIQAGQNDEISRVAHYPYRVIERADIDREIEGMETRVKRDSPQATDLGVLAALYYAQGKLTGNTSWFDRAEELAKKSLQIQTASNAGAKIVLAKVNAVRHDFLESIRLASEALKEDSGKTSSIAVIATSYLALGDLDKAGAYADQYVDSNPGLESYGLRALIMDAQGRSAEAINDFERALQIEDLGESQESAWVRSLFARSLMRKGDYRHAALLLSEALRSVPQYHLALDLMGELSMRQEHFEEAERYYKAAFESSKQLAYLSHYSRLETLTGDHALASEIQAQAELLIRAEMMKNGNGHRIDLASVLLDRARPEDIQESLKLATADVENRHAAIAFTVLARARLAAGDAKGALTTMRELLRTGVRDPDYYSQMSAVEKAVGNPRLADFYAARARELAH